MIAARLLVFLVLLAAPLAAEAQPATKTSRIGYLSPNMDFVEAGGLIFYRRQRRQ